MSNEATNDKATAETAPRGSVHRTVEQQNMELEIINKLYLELSQVATATTEKEIFLEHRIREAAEAARQLYYAIEEIGCSEAQTRASVMASALSTQIRDLFAQQTR